MEWSLTLRHRQALLIARGQRTVHCNTTAFVHPLHDRSVYGAADAVEERVHTGTGSLTQVLLERARPMADGGVEMQLARQPFALFVGAAHADHAAAIHDSGQLTDQMADAAGGRRHQQRFATRRSEDIVQADEGGIADGGVGIYFEEKKNMTLSPDLYNLKTLHTAITHSPGHAKRAQRQRQRQFAKVGQHVRRQRRRASITSCCTNGDALLRIRDRVRLPAELAVDVRADRKAHIAAGRYAGDLATDHRDAVRIVQDLGFEAGIDTDVHGFAQDLCTG